VINQTYSTITDIMLYLSTALLFYGIGLCFMPRFYKKAHFRLFVTLFMLTLITSPFIYLAFRPGFQYNYSMFVLRSVLWLFLFYSLIAEKKILFFSDVGLLIAYYAYGVSQQWIFYKHLGYGLGYLLMNKLFVESITSYVATFAFIIVASFQAKMQFKLCHVSS